MTDLEEWVRDRQRQQEAAHEQRFLRKLAAATTMTKAVRVCMDDCPKPGCAGRSRYTNLLVFLKGFAPASPGMVRVVPDRRLIPDQSSPNERAAYVNLARRLAAAGELSVEDLALVEQDFAR